jgi:hypothetical protein
MTYDGMLIGAKDGSGRLFRVFDPPWWRIDRWLGWYGAIALERVVGRLRSFFKMKPRAMRSRELLELHGVPVRGVIDDAVSLPNVPRRKQ